MHIYKDEEDNKVCNWVCPKKRQIGLYRRGLRIFTFPSYDSVTVAAVAAAAVAIPVLVVVVAVRLVLLLVLTTTLVLLLLTSLPMALACHSTRRTRRTRISVFHHVALTLSIEAMG